MYLYMGMPLQRAPCPGMRDPNTTGGTPLPISAIVLTSSWGVLVSRVQHHHDVGPSPLALS